MPTLQSAVAARRAKIGTIGTYVPAAFSVTVRRSNLSEAARENVRELVDSGVSHEETADRV
jgi:hypothetical protein